MQTLNYCTYESPIGEIIAITKGDVLCHLDFTDCSDRVARLLNTRYGSHTLEKSTDRLKLETRIEAYFASDWRAFDGLPIATDGTAFQALVWQALQAIPLGQTCSYLELAKAIGNPKAVRAVAGANARNPISIIVPCHRVIGSNGTLTGYAGGVERKHWLLRHEQAML